jgi:hypothetical protein
MEVAALGQVAGWESHDAVQTPVHRPDCRVAAAPLLPAAAASPWLFIVHDLNPRVLSATVQGFHLAQSWFQDLRQITMS